MRRAAQRLAVLCALLTAASVAAQVDNCSDCHLSRPDAPRPEHVSDWQRSEHSRSGVGCHDCHGGNPDTFERFAAHDGLVPSSQPSSPTHRSNLVSTCGGCHSGQFVEFRKSRHFELLSGDDGPTCSTCHGSVGNHLFSPQALARRCSRCHGTDRRGGHPEFPNLARALHERVIEIRDTLKPTRRLIRRIADDSRRAQLERMVEQAEVPLREAVHLGHSFRLDGLGERLDTSLERVHALLDELANPDPPPPDL